MAQLKPLPRSDVAAVLSRAEKCRAAGESDVAESMCLDALELEPDNQSALVMLLLARTDLIDRGMSRGVERAREILPRLTAALVGVSGRLHGRRDPAPRWKGQKPKVPGVQNLKFMFMF